MPVAQSSQQQSARLPLRGKGARPLCSGSAAHVPRARRAVVTTRPKLAVSLRLDEHGASGCLPGRCVLRGRGFNPSAALHRALVNGIRAARRSGASWADYFDYVDNFGKRGLSFFLNINEDYSGEHLKMASYTLY